MLRKTFLIVIPMGRYFRNCWAEKYRRNKNVALYPVRYDNRELILWRQCECSVINVCQKHHQVKSCRLYSLLKKCCSRCNLSLEKQCCRGISTPSLLPADSLLCSWLLLEADRLDSFRPSLGCALQQLSFQRNLVGCECDQVPSRQPCPAGAFSLAAGTTGRHPSGYSARTAWNHLAMVVLHYFVPLKFMHLLLDGSNSDFLMKNFCGRCGLSALVAPGLIFHDKWEFYIQESWDAGAVFWQHSANTFGG